MKHLDLILNGKGGVGKSFFAVNFVQFLKDRSIAHVAIDSDNENSTLKRFHPDTRFLDLGNRRELDGIFTALEKADLVVMDCRAASTDLFIDYFCEIDLTAVLTAMDAALTLVNLPEGLRARLGSCERDLASIEPKKLLEYCCVRRTADLASAKQMVRASGLKRDPRGTIHVGGVPVREKSYLLNWVTRDKRVDRVGMSYKFGPQMLDKAKRENDQKFLKAVRRAMQQGRRSGKIPDEVDWSKCHDLARFIVETWCGWPLPYSTLPPLCMFEGKARCTLCALLFGLRDNPSLDDSVRQHVQGLKRLKEPRIQGVERNGQFIRFISR